MPAPQTEEERNFRRFLRTTFKARLTVGEDGHNITSKRGSTYTAEIHNTDVVLAELESKCKLVKATSKVSTFSLKIKGKPSQIKVAQREGHTVLTLSIA